MRRSSTSRPRARIESAASYELVLSIAVAASDATTPEAKAVRGAAGDPLVDAVRRFASSDWMWAHLLSVAIEAPSPRDAPAFLAFLERLSARELQRRLAGYYVQWFRRLTAVDVMDAAIAGDARAIRAFVDRGYTEDLSWSRSLRGRLEAGTTRTKAELIHILDAWMDRVFDPVIEPTLRKLSAAADLRRRGLAKGHAGDLVPVLAHLDDAHDLGIEDLLLIPSLVIRPVRHEFEHGRTKLICFPVDPRRDAIPSPSLAVLAISRALADESRLRILMALVSSDLGAQELADRLGLGLSTVLHHLAELRAVGLVEHGGRRRPYRVDRRGVARAAAMIGRLTTRGLRPTDGAGGA